MNRQRLLLSKIDDRESQLIMDLNMKVRKGVEKERSVPIVSGMNDLIKIQRK